MTMGKRGELNSTGDSSEPACVMLMARSEQLARRPNRVTLTNVKDAHGRWRVALTCSFGAVDLRSIFKGTKILARRLMEAGLAVVEPLSPQSLFVAGGGCHHLGSTRMSARPEDGVVDRDLRVHDVANLFVAGTSVFPTSGWANPTLTAVALGLRLASWLAAGRSANISLRSNVEGVTQSEYLDESLGVVSGEGRKGEPISVPL
jgi:choline dehydrogenase-like flavoprotein